MKSLIKLLGCALVFGLLCHGIAFGQEATLTSTADGSHMVVTSPDGTQQVTDCYNTGTEITCTSETSTLKDREALEHYKRESTSPASLEDNALMWLSQASSADVARALKGCGKRHHTFQSFAQDAACVAAYNAGVNAYNAQNPNLATLKVIPEAKTWADAE